MRTMSEDPLLVIAGPGAGKTYNMVNEIALALPNLEPNRYLVAVTYTNAATDLIKERLLKVARTPPNVFIGTIHSFLNQFILIPYATIFDRIALDKLFGDINVDEFVQKSLGKRARNYALRNKVRSQVITRLLENGRVPFDQIAKVSSELMENKRVRAVVCNRIQYLFIDEFQDMNRHQFKVFDHIRKGKKTRIYAVGDPEQYIWGFTYIGRERPKFENIPINQFRARRITNAQNLRSFDEIVSFTNCFHTEMDQKAVKGSSRHSGVFFIARKDLDAIISTFRDRTQFLEADDTSHRPNTSGDKIKRFYLGFANNTFDDFTAKYGLTPISNDQTKPRSILDESLKLILAVVGMSQRQIREEHGLDHLGVRKLGIKLIEAVKNGEVKQQDELIGFVEQMLSLSIQLPYPVRFGNQLYALRNMLCRNEPGPYLDQYSSIHKAKGLEADAVLAVARSSNELRRWLTTDPESRRKDTTDVCRIGYVAFTRARQILCIACKQEIDDELRSQLSSLGVRII